MNKKRLTFLEEYINHESNIEKVDSIITDVVYDCRYKNTHLIISFTYKVSTLK